MIIHELAAKYGVSTKLIRKMVRNGDFQPASDLRENGTMTVHELAAKYDVRVGLIKKMVRDGHVCAAAGDDSASRMRACLSKDGQLSVKLLLALIDDPRIFSKLGKHKQRARDQVGELGNVRAGAAPPYVAASITDAAAGDADSVLILMQWIKSVLPVGPVGYHWIAARLLVHQLPNPRRAALGRVALAMEKVRAHPNFCGWWGTTLIGSQNRKTYHRRKLPFDL